MAGETIGWRAPADLGGLRQDPTYNRVSNHIHSAVGQFDVVLTGNAYCESGDVIPLFRSVSEGRIKDEKLRVHLYLLPDDWKTGNPSRSSQRFTRNTTRPYAASFSRTRLS